MVVCYKKVLQCDELVLSVWAQWNLGGVDFQIMTICYEKDLHCDELVLSSLGQWNLGGVELNWWKFVIRKFFPVMNWF